VSAGVERIRGRGAGGDIDVSDEIQDSYAFCRRQARQAASSFYWSFSLLPREQRDSMYALYAFLRHTDDLGDSDRPLPLRRRQLHEWRSSLQHALAGQRGDTLWPALADTVSRFSIPGEYLFDTIDGVEMDLDKSRYETFDQLEVYCHKVASVVGLACIHIWGFQGPRAIQAASRCGVAFQLTNILRDLKEDADRGRVYLPLEDLRHFNYGPDELMRGVRDHRFVDLMNWEIERAEHYYEAAYALPELISPPARRTLWAMVTTYRQTLSEIKRREGDVFSRKVRLRPWRKLQIVTRAYLSSKQARISTDKNGGD
jgi:phytoene synthase